MSDWQNPPLCHRMRLLTEDCPTGYDVLRYGDSVGVRWNNTQLGFVVDESDKWDGSDMRAVREDRSLVGTCTHWMEGVEMLIRDHEQREANR